jgi:hypothetical protein
VNLGYISCFQVLSEEFRKEHNITIPESCWLYKDKQYKLDYIKQNTSYEVIDNEYILAYKTTRSDGRSVFSPKYFYEVNKTYESNCDHNVNEQNSFGLSAWTKEKALEYYNKGKLLKVKINIEDIGAIVQNEEKIRAKKITILEEMKE